jgi:GNAT superfamily N-acetyltransferase
MIRRASPQDLHACSRLICDVIEEVESAYYSQDIIKGWQEHNSPSNLEKEAERAQFIVYEKNGTIVGVGAIAGAHIKKVYVLSSFQGTGIGKSIMEHLEQIGQNNGVAGFELNSTINAVNFYNRLGYCEQGPITIERNGMHVTFTRMTKSI